MEDTGSRRGLLRKRIITALLIAPFSVRLPACAVILGSEETIAFEALPPNIQLLVSMETDRSQIVEIEKERKYGRTIYAINYLIDGDEWEIEYFESGELNNKSRELNSE